jgi:hypothetical protein
LQRRLARLHDFGISTAATRKLAASVAGAALLLALSNGTQAATITVNTNIAKIAADGKCSLVEAIINANNDAATHGDCLAGSGDDIIVLPPASAHVVPGIYDTTYGNTRLPAITSTITIQGNGGKIQGTKKGGAARLIAVKTSGDLTLENLTISGGQHNYGGALFNSGSLTITDSTVTGNKALLGGAIANATGAILIIDHCTISKNTAVYGGGVFDYQGETTVSNTSLLTGNKAYSGAGIYERHGNLVVGHSTFTGNTAVRGAAIYHEGGTLTLENSLLVKNTSALFGGGFMSSNNRSPVAADCNLHIVNSTIANNRSGSVGGGISNESCSLTIQNTTISGNQAGDNGGGIGNFFGSLVLENSTISLNKSKTIGGGIWNQDHATFTNSTISGNTAKTGGGIFHSLRELTIKRTLISGNKAAIAAEVYNWASNTATAVADNYNLFGLNNSSGVVGFSAGASDIVPTGGTLITNILAPLANNGGSTLTHALVPGSPAIDASPVGGDCPAEDQRGIARPQGALCDIGAFEKEQP